MAPKDTELYDLLGVKPEATDIEYVLPLQRDALGRVIPCHDWRK